VVRGWLEVKTRAELENHTFGDLNHTFVGRAPRPDPGESNRRRISGRISEERDEANDTYEALYGFRAGPEEGGPATKTAPAEPADLIGRVALW
jgi:hypothetical protein